MADRKLATVCYEVFQQMQVDDKTVLDDHFPRLVPHIRNVLESPATKEKALSMSLNTPDTSLLRHWAAKAKLKAYRTPTIEIARPLDKADLKVIHDAWASPFVGTSTVDFFHTTINQRLSDEFRYSNSFAVIQSSGTGKSRLVDELAKRCFTFPVCLREPDTSEQFSHPPPDHVIRNFLLRRPENLLSSLNPLKLTSRCFFIALFQLGAFELVDIKETEDLAGQWRKHLEIHPPYPRSQARDHFYELVKSRATDYLNKYSAQLSMLQKATVSSDPVHQPAFGNTPPSTTPDSPADILEHLDNILMFDLHTLLEVIQLRSQSPISAPAKAFLEQRNQQRERVQSNLPEANKQSKQKLRRGHPVKIIITFDEAHTLLDLAPITSLFHTIVDFPIYMVYLATTSSITILAPTADVTDSMRLSNSDLHLNPPYTELPLRVFASADWSELISKPLYLHTFCHLQWAATLGRPLWSAMLKNGGEFKLLKIVTTKLLRDIPGSKISHSHVALSARCLLRTQNSQAGHRFASHLIASHLAVAFHISRDRDVIFAGYPPEPLVAAAATKFMVQTNLSHIPTLVRMLNFDMINKGDFGELVGRVCYLMARDAAFLLENPSYKEPSERVPFLEPVSLLAFLEYLVGHDNKYSINNVFRIRATNNQKAGTLRSVFKKAVVHFIAWCQAGPKVDTLTVANVLRALAQGCAIQCTPLQPVFDLVIPVVLDASKPLHCQNLGLLIVQIKNRRRHDTMTILCEDFPTDMPVIFIQHELDALGKPLAVNLERIRVSGSPAAVGAPIFAFTIVGVNPQLIEATHCQQLLQCQSIEEQYKNCWMPNDLAEAGMDIMLRQNLYGIDHRPASNEWAPLPAKDVEMHS